MAKELPPGTLLSDTPLQVDVGGGIVTDRPAGRQPTNRETDDLLAEVQQIANARATAERPAQQAAAREALVADLAVKLHGKTPGQYSDEEHQLLGSLVRVQTKGLKAADSSLSDDAALTTAKAQVQADLAAAWTRHEQAQKSGQPIIEDGMMPIERDIISKSAAARPATEAGVKTPKEHLPGQGEGRASVGKWTDQHAQRPSHTISKLR